MKITGQIAHPGLRAICFLALAITCHTRAARGQQPAPAQVTIDTTIIEITEDDAELRLLDLLGIAENTSHPLPAIADNASRRLVDANPGNALTQDRSTMLQWVISDGKRRTAVEALEQGHNSITVAPRVITLSGRGARVVAFRENAARVNGAPTPSREFDYTLEVIPDIAGNETISVTLLPAIRTLSGYDLNPTAVIWAYEGPPLNPGADPASAPTAVPWPRNPRPVFREQQIRTEAVIHRSETVVLFLRHGVDKAEQKLPNLADLPILPKSLRAQPKSRSILMLISPKIVNGSGKREL